MNKLPVGRTIRFAYAFTFGEIGTIIGLIWIPAVLNAIGSFLLLRVYNVGAVSSEGELPPGFGFLLLYFVVAALIVAMIAVAITRQALGLRNGPAIAHFSLGIAELRIFGGLFGLYLLALLFSTGVGLAAMLADTVAGMMILAPASGAAPAAAVTGLITLVGIAAVVYAVVRLSFLFVPCSVVEGEFGLARSWELTKGNFWRIVAVSLVTLLPVVIAFATAELAILGPEYLNSLAAMLRDQAHAAQYMAEQARLTDEKTPILLGLGFVLTPITYGLVFAPAAFAYRALSGGKVLPSEGAS